MPPQATTKRRTDRAIALIRVSKEGGRGDALLSPDLQRAAIDEMAARTGTTVVQWVEAIDESGSQTRSTWWPRLEEAVASIERGDADVVIAWKFSRVARNRARWAVAVDRIERVGGRVISATEGVDDTTSTGRFTRGMLVEMAAFEAERIGETWREVQHQRVSKGLTHNGRRRFGYQLDEKRVHQPDPETAPILVELYQRFTRGESVYRLTQWLNAAGVPTTTGAQWTDRTLRRMMNDGFAAGLIRSRDQLLPGAHPAVITEAAWSAYQTAKAARTRSASQMKRSPYLLSGLVRCGHCGGSMHAGTFGENRTPKYRCETKRGTGGSGCAEGGYVSARQVHDAVLGWLATIASQLDDATATVEPDEDPTIHRRVRAAQAEVDRVERALVKLSQQWLEDDLDEDEYRVLRTSYRERREAARAELAAAEYVEQVAQHASPAVVIPILEAWDTLAVDARRDMLRSLVSHFDVFKEGPRKPPRVVPVTYAESTPTSS